MSIVDLRSDTVTKPTPGMRAAMANAEVGDDVIDRDPTADRLQEQVAELLGKEAALFMPSGTMTNQIAVRIHCKPGDEFLCEAGCHIYNYEQGAFAQLSGLVAHTVEGVNGVLRPEQLEGLIRPENDHLLRTRLVCLENTHNRGAGKIQPYDDVVRICRWAHENGLRTHLDGARLFNAAVATGISERQWSEHFDTVSVCFSKGLGAPIGSVLAGSKEMIREARRHRKLFGGGMRQAGVIASAAIYALEHHRERLAEDHRRAKALAAGIAAVPGLRLTCDPVETNIVIFEIAPSLGTAGMWVEELRKRKIAMLSISPGRVRAVTHLEITDEAIIRAIAAIQAIAAEKRGG